MGDPAEYDSIRQVFGGLNRPNPLQFGSVKGLVGHTEASSGIVSLIKVLLMIQEGYIPPQANFGKINPSINASTSDKMEITTSLIPWNDEFRAALINNYGASGSNASMVVTQIPQLKPRASLEVSTGLSSGDIKYPFWFSGFDDRGLLSYATRFRHFLRSKAVSSNNISIANLSFNVSRQSNRSLDRALIFSCRSVDELDQKLAAFENGDKAVPSIAQPPHRPVILCFGG